MSAEGAEASDARTVAVLAGVLFGLTGTGSAAASVVVPSLVRDLGAAPARGAWVISVYALALAVGTAVYGRLADRHGTRWPLGTGVLLMAGGAALAATATRFDVLLAARLLQGAGAASVPVLVVAVVSERYAGLVRSAALARVTGVAVTVGATTPLLGGAVEALLGWRPVIALPALGLLVLAALWRSTSTARSDLRLDALGAVLVTVTAAGVVLLVQAVSTGRGVALVGALLVLVGAPGLAARVQRRPDGFLPRSVVTSAVVVRSALVAATVPASWFGLLVALPAVLTARGWAPLAVGLALLPSAVPGLLTPRFAGPLLARRGPRRSLVLAAGLALAAVLLAAAGSAGPVWLLVTAMVTVNVAFGVGQPALSAAVLSAVPAETAGAALGVATLVFLVGGGIGSAVAGLGPAIGASTALLVLAVLPALAGAALLVMKER